MAGMIQLSCHMFLRVFADASYPVESTLHCKIGEKHAVFVFVYGLVPTILKFWVKLLE